MNARDQLQLQHDFISHAETIITCIEDTIQRYDPCNYYDQLIPPPEHISLADCDIPDFIDDPLAIVRYVHGEGRAQWLQYEDDIETILQEIEECKAELSRACDVKGDEEGEEPAGC